MLSYVLMKGRKLGELMDRSPDGDGAGARRVKIKANQGWVLSCVYYSRRGEKLASR